MSSNVTAILVALIGCATTVALVWISKGTQLFAPALLAGIVLIPVSLLAATKIAENDDEESNV